MKENEKSCQGCAHRKTEYLTPIYEDDYGIPIMGIDYQFRCKIYDIVVQHDYHCDKFELPF